MAEEPWTAVDAYIADRLLPSDPALDAALAANAAAGLPAIDVSPAQGKFLHLLARIVGARRILEVGTLGGYSTIWLARGLAEGGAMVSLEIDPRHAAVARANVDRVGVGDRVDIRVAPARDTLAAMVAAGEGPFDLVFIDADKENNAHYVRQALALSRPGTVIVVDNVVRKGRVADFGSSDPMVLGSRAVFDLIAAEPRLDATALQTVGLKGWDGLAIAVVD
ncbi:O-methyltransferase [Sphingomonas flavalba]|uniref:O-methyltransferase n=1 Tax=Sphingomonas flavalba TaxID=2559804 RepID=UPI0039E1ED3B